MLTNSIVMVISQYTHVSNHWASQVAQRVKNLPVNTGDVGLIPGSGRSSEEGNDYPLQYSCLENSTDRGYWWAYGSWVAESTFNTFPFASDCFGTGKFTQF